MTDQEIRDCFDQDLNMTFNKLSEISGRSLEELRIILSE
jgi:predicted HTH domain antitoxin